MSRYASSSVFSFFRSRAESDRVLLEAPVVGCDAARLLACLSSRSLLKSSARIGSSLSQGASRDARVRIRWISTFRAAVLRFTPEEFGVARYDCGGVVAGVFSMTRRAVWGLLGWCAARYWQAAVVKIGDVRARQINRLPVFSGCVSKNVGLGSCLARRESSDDRAVTSCRRSLPGCATKWTAANPTGSGTG